MRRANHIGAALAVCVVLFGAAIPGAAAAMGTGSPAPPVYQQSAPTSNNSTVSASLGQQLSTVIAATSDDVRTEVEDSAFEAELHSNDETARAQAIANRATDLRTRAQQLRTEYRSATSAYEQGNLSATEYAQRLAVLHARANNVLHSLDQLRRRAADVSALELEAAGVTRADLQAIETDLETLAGAGPSALLRQFDGRSNGNSKVEIDEDHGLEISVESEDGEHSREVRKSDDGDSAIVVNQTEALTIAEDTLSDHPWSLRRAGVQREHGYYSFAFTFATANTTGEAKVRVDGSNGAVVRLEEEVKRRGADDEGDDGEQADSNDGEGEAESHEHVSLLLADGTPGPNQTVTVVAMARGQPVPNATVTMNGAVVGTTDADGTLTVTLPDGEAKLSLARGDAELEFEHEGDDSEVYRHLRATGTIHNGTASMRVIYGGSGVDNATVYGEDGVLGTTDADGRLTFRTTATERLELTVVKGEFSADLTLTVDGSSLSLRSAERGDHGDEQADDRKDDRGDEKGDRGDDKRDDSGDDVEKGDGEDGHDDTEAAETPESTETPEPVETAEPTETPESD